MSDSEASIISIKIPPWYINRWYIVGTLGECIYGIMINTSPWICKTRIMSRKPTSQMYNVCLCYTVPVFHAKLSGRVKMSAPCIALRIKRLWIQEKPPTSFIHLHNFSPDSSGFYEWKIYCIETKAPVTMMDVPDIWVVICWKYQGRGGERLSKKHFDVRFLVFFCIIRYHFLRNTLVYI